MSLSLVVEEIFGEGSRLAGAIPAFSPRQGQTEMAVAIARAIEQGGSLVVEAGTGVGKTFSYLVPALLCGHRVLVSTATKNLQDQLFNRDLPRLINALGLPVRTALLKGRSSYLCLHRLELARREANSGDRILARSLALIERWSQSTLSGDLAELSGLDERSPAIPLVTSTRDNCLGSQCPRFRACHVNHARKDALGADLVVVNHHLFFADMTVRESGMAELLPTVRTVIFDEAHQLNEIGVQFLGEILGTAQLLEFANDLLAAGLTLARGLAPWQELAARVEEASRDLRMHVGKHFPGTKLGWTTAAPQGVHQQDWAEAMQAIDSALQPVASALGTVVEMAPDFVRLLDRLQTLQAKTGKFRVPCNADSVRWVEVGSQIRLVESPLDIAEAMRDRLLRTDSPEPALRSWVFTSATLGDDADLTWFTEPCGLASAKVLKVQSPFSYARQAAIYVPRNLPKPADVSHSAQVAALAAKAVQVLRGRTLVLTTTLRALKVISAAMQAAFQDDAGIQILVQGQGPKRELMDKFRQGGQSGEPGRVLVASASFWEGFDVPGDALQLVIIDKLPFPPPSDPLVVARSARLERAGRSPFNDYFLPEAAIALKQGAGRLIRQETDQGVLVVCDTRLVAMGYGKRLVAALPPMRRMETEGDFLDCLDRLTKASTRDPRLA
jgi:ATP-dependent DNA helicase DinG